MNLVGYRFVCAAAAAAAITAAVAAGASARLEAQPPGKNVYDAHCVECHGASGRGDAKRHLFGRTCGCGHRDAVAGVFELD